MIEPARDLDQVALAQMDSSGSTQETAPIPYWQRQPGEPLLWYSRFKIYRSLGYKRSLVAALQKEREKAMVLESPKTAEKSDVGGSVSSTKPRETTRNHEKNRLVEVPKQKPVQVPGSWKQASIKYHWVERAAAYDAHQVDKWVQESFDELYEGFGLGIQRIRTLESIARGMGKKYNEGQSGMSWEQENFWIARLQSVLRDIRDEMAVYDEVVTRVILQRVTTKQYQNWEPPVEKKDYERITEKLGGPDKARQALEQEQAKRKRGQ